MDDSDFSSVVLDIYETVSEPSTWPKVLDRISERLNARGCIVFEWDLSGERRMLHAPIITSGYDRKLMDDYIRRNHELEAVDQDIFEKRLLEFDEIEVIDEAVVYETDPNYFKKAHVQELLDLNIRYRTGALLDRDNPYRSRFSLQLSQERGQLDEADLGVLLKLLPHVAKALDISRPIGGFDFERAALTSIVDSLDVGVCIVDGNGCVVKTNPEFVRQCEDYNAFKIDRHDRLTLHEHGDHRRFLGLMESTRNHGRFGARPRKEAVLIETDDRAGALCIEIVPVDRPGDFGKGRGRGAFIVSRDTTRPISVEVDLVQRIRDLTNAETEVVELVCDGLTNTEIAERRNRAVATVNAQLKTILSKCQVRNRTQLVRYMCNYSLPSAVAI